ncbi:helix-turn-helix domain-containing protein [Streptomyces sp. NPDC016845]|uniref:helix-turn-helix domain-containing protein n=1 Tax=Streptomyces sp. NPDC016845 TaxID=3364972 RepID=UPI00379422FF
MNRVLPPPAGGRPGRKLGPIRDEAGPTHRAWLEPLRDAFLASGMTLQELERNTGWSRSKISELLRAAGRYPRWEFIRALLGALGWPSASIMTLRTMWAMAAREANKRTHWINDCVVGDLERTPVNFTAFQAEHRAIYFAYAATFRRRPAEAARAVTDVFNLLLIVWDEAVASANVNRFVWKMLRGTVLERTVHIDGHPALAEVAFATQALRDVAGGRARVLQINESLKLYNAISRLPAQQLDVMVLLHIHGLEETAVADVMGLHLPTVRSIARHASRALDAQLFPGRSTPEGEPGDNSS